MLAASKVKSLHLKGFSVIWEGLCSDGDHKVYDGSPSLFPVGFGLCWANQRTQNVVTEAQIEKPTRLAVCQ
jgi:hypothetical protein